MPDAAGTLVKMYWSIVGQVVQISVSMEFKIFKQAGWFAIGISDAPAANNPMTNATIVLNWVDRFGNGYGYVANSVSTATVAPTFTDPPTVSKAVIGVSQVIKGQDDLVTVSFEKPVATWVGANKQLMFAWKESDSFDPAKAPEALKRFEGTKHTESLKVPNFDFSVASTTCDAPGAPVTPVDVDPCVATPTGTFANGVSVPLSDTNVVINALFDCAAKEVEFTVSGESAGWLAFGFNDAAQMPGTDTYQVFLDAAGKAQVRNGHVAAARNVLEDSVADAQGSRNGRLLQVTFKRKFDTGSVNDKPLGFGKKYFINVARNDAAGALPSAKHTEKASSAAAIELFRDNGPIPGGPCALVDTFEHQEQATLAGKPVAVSMRVDCVRAEATFEVSGPSLGWLAFGLGTAAQMPGTDTYQVRINDLGKPEVRNGFAVGYTVSEDNLIAGAVGERVGDQIRVSFKRKLYPGADRRDAVLFAGRPIFLHVSRNNNAGAAFTAKHSEKTPAAAPIDLFTEAFVDKSPCDTLDSFSNSVVVPLDTTEVTVAYTIDCKREKIRFTVTGESKGWLAVGFTVFPNKMSGADTYQIRSSGSSVQVRNGRAVGRAVVEDNILAGVTGSRVGDVLSATFERALDTGLAGNDVKFAFGLPYHINVARRTDDDDWTKKHNFRAWSDEAIELFTVGTPAGDTTLPTQTTVATAPPGGDPCAVPNGKFSNTVSLSLASQPVTIAVKGDCATKTLEFTLSGTSKGWLAFGIAPRAGDMNDADVYQVRIGAGGAAEVRNAFAEDYGLLEDELIAGATGSRDGDKLSVTFKRPFASTRGTRDTTLGFGKAFYFNVAKRDADGDFALKHNLKASSPKQIDLFFVAPPPTTPGTGTPSGTGDGAGAVTDGPCKDKASFSNKYTQPLSGGDVKVSYTVDCAAGTIEIGLSSKFKDAAAAWLGLGFADTEGKMPGSDTYQVRVQDGKAQVRFGKADGKDIEEEQVLDATGGVEDDGDLDVKFKRPLKPADTDKDADLSFGKKWYFNVARRETDNEWSSKHTSKTWSANKIDIWTDGELIDPVGAATPAATLASVAIAIAAMLIMI